MEYRVAWSTALKGTGVGRFLLSPPRVLLMELERLTAIMPIEASAAQGIGQEEEGQSRHVLSTVCLSLPCETLFATIQRSRAACTCTWAAQSTQSKSRGRAEQEERESSEGWDGQPYLTEERERKAKDAPSRLGPSTQPKQHNKSSHH